MFKITNDRDDTYLVPTLRSDGGIFELGAFLGMNYERYGDYSFVCSDYTEDGCEINVYLKPGNVTILWSSRTKRFTLSTEDGIEENCKFIDVLIYLIT